MENHVNVIIKEDDSVQKAIKRKARELEEKYSKNRKINEKFLKPRSKLQKIISGIGTGICVVLVTICFLLFCSVVNCKIQKIPTSFAGFSSMTVSSGSMVKSGFKIGDKVIAKSVNTKTLKDNDIIAFYVYRNNYKDFKIEDAVQVDPSTIGKVEYATTFAGFFGSQPELRKQAANAKCSIVFHHIRHVYEDDTGKRWFTTYGSSNVDPAGEETDVWYVSEDMVLGAYDDSGFGKMAAGILNWCSTPFGLILILLIPLILLGLSLVYDLARNIQCVKLELDIVEEKRKLTDSICVKNNIGFKMDTKTKYKVLAQAKPNEKMQYISLLWKRGSVPNNIQKYYMRKELMLKPNERLLNVNRECERRYKNGDNMEEVAKYYMEEKRKIKEDQLVQERNIRKLHRDYDKQEAEKLEAEQEMQKQLAESKKNKKSAKASKNKKAEK